MLFVRLVGKVVVLNAILAFMFLPCNLEPNFVDHLK